MEVSRREQQSMLAVQVGLAANVLLAFLKTTVGVLGNSPALLADGINSTSDVIAYLVVAVFMKRAGAPADLEHPFGHRQLESIAALTVGSFVITAAVAIFWNAINSIYKLWAGEGDATGASLLALWVALFTVAAKVGLTYFTSRIGRRTGNAAVIALAYDHRNDLLAALAVAVGILLARMGYLWVDPLAGAVVALFVLGTGLEILRKSSLDLMDTVPGRTLGERITTTVQAVEGVRQVEEIYAHRFGPYLVVNLTIGIDGEIPVTAGDAIASAVERALYAEVSLLRQVHVHYHPVGSAVSRPNLISEEPVGVVEERTPAGGDRGQELSS